MTLLSESDGGRSKKDISCKDNGVWFVIDYKFFLLFWFNDDSKDIGWYVFESWEFSLDFIVLNCFVSLLLLLLYW